MFMMNLQSNATAGGHNVEHGVVADVLHCRLNPYAPWALASGSQLLPLI